MEVLIMRTSGVLMPISSLPGDFGIGTLGEYAYKFVDLLKESGQTYWQILPLCPTSFGDSPYQSFSTFAGNPYFIDLDKLCNDGLLNKQDYISVNWGNDQTKVDYSLIYQNRNMVLSKVQKKFFQQADEQYTRFCQENEFWLDDYALFMAVKDSYNGISFTQWDEKIKTRDPLSLHYYQNNCGERLNYYKMLQYLFFKQWKQLKKYANDNGIKIIGDVPIYVALDSADVWADPKQFFVDENIQPIEVAGCPPDGFSAVGQLWGNPLYNWQYMKTTGYSWWERRLKSALENYDVVRIDHFRGFDSYYSIPYCQKTAVNGHWNQGPGIDLFRTLESKLGKMPIIAEDLGFLTDSVKQLLKESGYPGMKVLQFAFNPNEESDYLPHKYNHNCVVYTGTHDNDTILGWEKTSRHGDVEFAKRYLNCNEPLNYAMVRAASSSVGDTCIVTMQDLLSLSSEARMNAPSTVGTNWKWRCRKEDMDYQNFTFLAEITGLYGRKRKD
ncbi:MAG: 4-alpha-glucanotransferase [Erysipelotrichaceae bacterium]